MLAQRTLTNPIKASGVGLHSGRKITIKLLPAPEDTGIIFQRVDCDPIVEIQATVENVGATALATTLVSGDIEISTVEHMLSAFAGLGIDNAYVQINDIEVPIMDGSSLPFVEELENSGIVTQEMPREIISVKKEIFVSNNDSYAKITPNKQFSIDFEIDFESQLVSKQACQLQLINGNYKTDVSSARTFGFEKDVDYLQANGLALGGSLDNAVVVGEKNILNKEGLRFNDEFVRHKILDSIGDLYLAGKPIQGYFYGSKSGHFLNNQLLKKIFSDKSNFEII